MFTLILIYRYFQMCNCTLEITMFYEAHNYDKTQCSDVPSFYLSTKGCVYKYVLDIPPTCGFCYFKARKVKAVEDLKSCPETPRSLTSPLNSGLDLHLKFDIKRNSLLQQGFVLLFCSGDISGITSVVFFFHPSFKLFCR